MLTSTKFVQIMPLAAKNGPPRMSHVLFVEVLHPVNFVNITHVKSYSLQPVISKTPRKWF